MARYLLDNDPRREQRRQDRLMKAIEAQHTAALVTEIERATRAAVAEWEETGTVPQMQEHRARVEAIINAMAQSAVRAFGARVLLQQRAMYGLEVKSFLDTMIQMASRYIFGEAVRRRITAVADTTRGMIVGAVAEGFDRGLGVSQIAKAVLDAAPQIAEWRGPLIARTETHGAANYGAQQAAKATGLPVRKEWVAAGDERTRKSHRAADGKKVGLDERFNIGGAWLLFPGDPDGPPGETINCRCAIAHIVDDGLP